jgi:hypothetical protein
MVRKPAFNQALGRAGEPSSPLSFRGKAISRTPRGERWLEHPLKAGCPSDSVRFPPPPPPQPGKSDIFPRTMITLPFSPVCLPQLPAEFCFWIMFTSPIIRLFYFPSPPKAFDHKVRNYPKRKIFFLWVTLWRL